MIVSVREVGDPESGESILEVKTVYDDSVMRIENEYTVKGYMEAEEEKIAVRHIVGCLEFDENTKLNKIQKYDVRDCVAVFRAMRQGEILE